MGSVLRGARLTNLRRSTPDRNRK